jgi:hypothetical protein
MKEAILNLHQKKLPAMEIAQSSLPPSLPRFLMLSRQPSRLRQHVKLPHDVPQRCSQAVWQVVERQWRRLLGLVRLELIACLQATAIRP